MRTLGRKLAGVVVVSWVSGVGGLLGCGEDGQLGESGSTGAAGADALVTITAEPAGDHCAYAGSKVASGVDANGDGRLADSETAAVEYVCGGAPGAAGRGNLVRFVDEGAGARCEMAGLRVDLGIDADGNGNLVDAEVAVTRYLCNGGDAAAGLSSLVNVSPEQSGSHCATGGQRLDTGIDQDGDGTLAPSEVVQTQYLCGGATGVAGVTGANGLSSRVIISDEAPGDHCAEGGKQVQTGLDADGDALLSPGEISLTDYVCNGLAGAAGVDGAAAHAALVHLLDEIPGAGCPHGGKRVESGLDSDDSGGLDPGEVLDAQRVCNGVPGSAGASGLDALVSVADEPAGASCASGGESIRYGLDANGNGDLELAEVTDTRYVCDGAEGAPGTAGSNGLDSLVQVADEAAGGNCAAGGERIDYGRDDSRDGVLDPAEIDGVRYVCDGAAGSPGAAGLDGLASLVSFTAEPVGVNCATGGQMIASGIDDDANGTLDPGEVDATFYVCNGNG